MATSNSPWRNAQASIKRKKNGAHAPEHDLLSSVIGTADRVISPFLEVFICANVAKIKHFAFFLNA